MEAPDDIRGPLRELAKHPKVVAIGETGLDRYRLPSANPGGTKEDDERYFAKQAVVFEQQLEVASGLGLNCVIHQRSAFEPTMEQMASYKGKVRGVFHCFADGPEAARKVLATGEIGRAHV